MTTLHKITPEWAGETVAVLACGPSLGAAMAESLRVHKTIVVNEAHRLAPWADMLVALDGNWPQAFRDFAGVRVTGVDDDALDALYIGPCWERVVLSPHHTIEIRNSGLTAVRLAASMGAARIILAGFDYPGQTGRFYDDEVDTGQYSGLEQGLKVLSAGLAAQGVLVERLEPAAAGAEPMKKKGARV